MLGKVVMEILMSKRWGLVWEEWKGGWSERDRIREGEIVFGGGRSRVFGKLGGEKYVD